MGARRIFVSYRRDESAAIVGRICDHLVEFLGRESVFKDVDSIAPGEDFRIVLRTSIRRCDAMLVVVGPEWLAPTTAGGQARLFDGDDYVRAEIEQAIADDVILVPVLVDGASMPSAASLPATVQALAYRQAVQIRSDPDFHSDIERLLENPPFELDIERASHDAGPNRPKGSIVSVRQAGAAVGLLVAIALLAVVIISRNPAPETADTSSANTSGVRSAGTEVATRPMAGSSAPISASSTESNATGASSPAPSVAAGAVVAAADAFAAGRLLPLDASEIAVPSEYIDAQADSTLASQGRFTYRASNLIDRDLETAWSEGAAGLGKGLHLAFRFASPMPLARIEIWPGWQTTSPCLFEKNARPTTMTAVATPETGELVSAQGEQADPTNPRSRLVIDLPTNTYTEIVLALTEVTRGTFCDDGPFDDTAISEIRFFAGACADGFEAINGELAPAAYPNLPTSC